MSEQERQAVLEAALQKWGGFNPPSAMIPLRWLRKPSAICFRSGNIPRT